MAAWSDLPPELLTKIGRSLHTSLDVLRFRSVCKSWRFSLPFSESHHFSVSHLDLRLPWVNVVQGYEGPVNTPGLFSFPVRNTVCSLQQDATSSGWLVNVLETKGLGRNKSLRDPFIQFSGYNGGSYCRVSRFWDLNVLDITIRQRSRFYMLVEELKLEAGRSYWNNDKVLVFPDSVWSSGNDLWVLRLARRNRDLRLWRIGDDKWTKIDNPGGFSFHDIATCEGRFFAVDATGVVLLIDRSNAELVRCSSPLSSGVRPRKSNRLVVSGSDLFVVETFFEQRQFDVTKLIGFKIHRLSRKGSSWVEVRDLGDQALVLGKYESFFVSSKDFVGCRAHYVYYHTFTSNYNQCSAKSWNAIAKFSIADKSINDVESFLGYHHPVLPPLPPWLSKLTDLSFYWTPPPADCFKFNVAGVLRHQDFLNAEGTGIGGVLRDCNGATVTTFSKHLGVVDSVEKAELLAVLEALVQASESDWGKNHDITIESESSILVSWFSHPNTRPLEYMDDFVAGDKSIQSIKQVVFHHTSSEANTFARCLALQAIHRPAGNHGSDIVVTYLC